MIVYLHMRHTAGTAAANAQLNAALAPYYGQVAPYHRGVPANEIKHVYVNETTPLQRVISGVTAAVGSHRSLWRLMINCHGSPGTIHLGAGLTVSNAAVFRSLQPFMTPNGSGITVGCCYAAAGGQVPGLQQGCLRQVSSGTNGLSLLVEIARYANVRVEGALDEQITWELNGPVLTVLPNGSYTIRMGRTETAIRAGQSRQSYDCARP